MNIAYVRVSTREQHEDRQIEALEKYGIDKWYIEKISGKDTNRPQFQEMMSSVQEGDTVYIHEFSRLARSTKDLLEIAEILKEKGVSLVSNKENIDSSTATGKLMLTMIAAIAEFERQCLLERQKEGIAIAQRKGVYKECCGRKNKEVDMRLFRECYMDHLDGMMTKVEMASRLGVARSTLDRIIAREVA